MNTDNRLKSTVETAWDNATRRANWTPLLTAIGEAIALIDEGEVLMVEAARLREFSERIAKRGSEHPRGGVALDFCENWSGEWHVANTDLVAWDHFRMWLRRSPMDLSSGAMLFSEIHAAIRNKRMHQAWERYRRTGLRRVHCTLLEHLGWRMDTSRNDGYSLYVEGKRPFGNSCIVNDIFDLCGWAMDWPDLEGPSDAHEERAWEIFDELAFAAPDAARLARLVLGDDAPKDPKDHE